MTWGKVIYYAKTRLDEKLVSSIWRQGGYEALFGEILQGVYNNEVELLENLNRILQPYVTPVTHLDKSDMSVTSRVLLTHSKYFIGQNKSRCEVGDIAFIIIYIRK